MLLNSLMFRARRAGVYYVDQKNKANAAFSFFFSNSLLSFTPFDPRIRLRFQTLLSGC